MRISITGSRNLSISFSDISSHLPSDVTSIISGGASGIDTIAANYARKHGIELVVIRPQYSKFSDARLAPLARNTDIVSQSDYCLFFWDGISKGTKDTINKAIKLGKHGKVIVLGSCVASSVMRF